MEEHTWEPKLPHKRKMWFVNQRCSGPKMGVPCRPPQEFRAVLAPCWFVVRLGLEIVRGIVARPAGRLSSLVVFYQRTLHLG